MAYTHFSLNGKLLPTDQAVISLSSLEYSYGFGVYESVRVSGSTPHFLEEHSQRLLDSAKIIGLDHPFMAKLIQDSAQELVKKNKVEACNLKILLIGGATAADANLYMQCLNPHFPDRKLYKSGVKCITREYERDYPHAKTLNMLPSYLAFRQAKQAGAYDALLINSRGYITEGTRTNFFLIKDKTIVSPPEADILLGVTRHHVLQIAKKNGFKVIEQTIQPADLVDYDGAFLTSTSAKIMPITTIDDHAWESIPTDLQDLMQAFDSFLGS